MAVKGKYRSRIAEAVHRTVEDMFEVGTIDEAEMRHFDEACLANSSSISPKRIKKIRQSQKVSQPEFARRLNISESTVSKWESGAKKPSGIALKLLSVVEKHGLQILA